MNPFNIANLPSFNDLNRMADLGDGVTIHSTRVPQRICYPERPGTKVYRVNLRAGLGGPYILDALDEQEARNMGIAEYRRTSGSSDIVDLSDPKTIVESVSLETEMA